MLRIRPHPAPRPEARTKAARPPLAYIDLLTASEADFRRTVAEIEADPLFAELRAIGAVRRRGGRGRMPAERYEERLDAQVAAFVKQYGLDRHPDALTRLQEALRSEGPAALARRLGAPVAEVRRLARFLEPSEGPRDEGRRRPRVEEPVPGFEDFIAGAPPVDLSQATEVVRDFVERHSLSQAQLVTDFLHAESSPRQLALRYRTTEAAIRAVLDAVDFVLTADAVATPQPARRARAEDRDLPVVAHVYLREGEPQLTFGEDTGYGLRYVIDPARLGALEGEITRGDAEELMEVLRHVNQRRNVQCRVVAAVFERQRRYFASGDDLDLAPLGQADLARELDEHQSTISRAVRNRYLRTPYGSHELQYYCQRKRDVIARLCSAHPDASDREIGDLLLTRFGCRIARRTVAYHRAGHRR
jgi:hypothetical protein